MMFILNHAECNFKALKLKKLRTHVLQNCLTHSYYPRSRVQTQPKPLDFSGEKNSQHAFLWKGSKAVCPMSQICGMLKNPTVYCGSRKPSAKLSGHLSPIFRFSLTEVFDVA